MRTYIARIGILAFIGILAVSSARAADEIIIDEVDAKPKGNWDFSKGSAMKFKDGYKVSSTTDQTAATATMSFYPRIETSGRYDVYVWYTSGENRSTTAPVTIACKSGTTVYKIDQKKNGGQWVLVAKGQEFEAGNSGSITIGNNTGATGSMVVADAVRLVLTSTDTGYAINFSPATGGTISKEPNKAAFSPGSEVKITALADDGFVFNGWTGDVTGLANPVVVTMDKDKNIGATFVQGGIGVVMDSDEAKFEGDWQPVTDKKWGKPHSDSYKWISCGKDKPTKASATFTPDIPRAGIYDIYVWYVPGSNRSRTSPFEVSCKDGKQIYKVNQQTGGNDWVLLAPAKTFDAGKKSDVYVKLLPTIEEDSAVVVADAVAFVYAGPAGGQTVKR
jgi:hypothetical protein